MNRFTSILMVAFVATTTLASCEVVGGVFKAGFWTAIILIILVVVLIFWLLRRSGR